MKRCILLYHNAPATIAFGVMAYNFFSFHHFYSNQNPTQMQTQIKLILSNEAVHAIFDSCEE